MAKKRTKGGDWAHADAIYGSYPHHAANGYNGMISTTGGGKRKGGRGLMTDIAVPAALLMASNYLGRKNTKHRRSNRNKRARFTRRRR